MEKSVDRVPPPSILNRNQLKGLQRDNSKSLRQKNQIKRYITCSLKRSTRGSSVRGSTSCRNVITSSTDQVEGSSGKFSPKKSGRFLTGEVGASKRGKRQIILDLILS